MTEHCVGLSEPSEKQKHSLPVMFMEICCQLYVCTSILFASKECNICIQRPPNIVIFFLSESNNMHASRQCHSTFVTEQLHLCKYCVLGLFRTIRVRLSLVAAVFLCAVPQACCLWKQLWTSSAERGS